MQVAPRTTVDQVGASAAARGFAPACERGGSSGGPEDDDVVGCNVVPFDDATVRVANTELTHARRRAQSEVHSRVLRRQIARPRLHLAYEPATVGRTAVTTAPGENLASRTASQWPTAPVGRKQLELPADRVDGDVHPAVVVEVGRREAAADDAGKVVPADECGPVRESGVDSWRRAHVLEHLDRLRVSREIRDRDSAVGEHEVGLAVEVEVDPGDAPAA